MEFSIERVAAMPTPLVRSALAPWVAGHLEATPEARAALVDQLQRIVDAASDGEIDSMRITFANAGDTWRFHPADPLARRVTRAYMAAAVQPWWFQGREPLDRFLTSPAKRRMVVCNHLSYTDTQVTDVVLALAGQEAFANRLVAIAGPKVYTEPWRRMASIALNTRKTAQSSRVASEQGALGPRELAVVALETLADAVRLMDQGYIVLLYPEGTRARHGRLQPFLRAAARYLAIEGLEVMPLGQVGGEQVFPMEATIMRQAAVNLVCGDSFLTADYAGKAAALEECHRRVAALLPDTYQPAAGSLRVD